MRVSHLQEEFLKCVSRFLKSFLDFSSSSSSAFTLFSSQLLSSFNRLFKTIGCFDKTTGYFSLSLKNNFLLKRLRMLMLWIQSRMDYTLNLPQILSKRQLSNNKNNWPSIILQRVWILQSLNTLGSTSNLNSLHQNLILHWYRFLSSK